MSRTTREKDRAELIDGSGGVLGTLSNRAGCAYVELRSIVGERVGRIWLRQIPTPPPAGSKSLVFIYVPPLGRYRDVVRVAYEPVREEFDEDRPEAVIFLGEREGAGR